MLPKFRLKCRSPSWVVGSTRRAGTRVDVPGVRPPGGPCGPGGAPLPPWYKGFVHAEASTADHADPIPIFVGGLHRSGTTLLADLIGAHPDVLAAPRHRRVPRRGPVPPGRDADGVAVRWPRPVRVRRPRAPHRGRRRGPCRRAGAPAARELVAVLGPRPRPRGREVAAEPAAVPVPPGVVPRGVVHRGRAPSDGGVVRAPRAGQGAVGRLLDHWLVAHERFESDRPQVRQLLFVRYEDLVHDVPGDARARSTTRSALRRDVPDTEVRRDTNARYLRRWRNVRGCPGASADRREDPLLAAARPARVRLPPRRPARRRDPRGDPRPHRALAGRSLDRRAAAAHSLATSPTTACTRR